MLSVDIWSNFIRVISYGQLPESRVYPAFVNIDGYTKIVIRVTRTLEVKVYFVDGEGEVGCIYGDEDMSAVLDEACRARKGFRIARANEDAVEYGLRPSRGLRRVESVNCYYTLRVRKCVPEE